MLTEDLSRLTVWQRLLRVLGADQLFDQCPNGRRRVGNVCLGRYAATAEILQFEYSARRRHVFLCRYPGYGGFIQAQNVCNFTQDQWSHSDFAMIEKLALSVNDRPRHAQNVFKTPLHTYDQPPAVERQVQSRVAWRESERRGC